jgi:hypothetical protein
MSRETPKYRKIEILEKFIINAKEVAKYPSLEDASNNACESVSYWAVREWAKKDGEIATLLGRALLGRAETYHKMAHEVLQKIEDFWTDKNGITRERMQAVNKAKLIVEHYRWHASKMCPEIYGDYYYEIKQMENKIKDISTKLDEYAKQNKK